VSTPRACTARRAVAAAATALAALLAGAAAATAQQPVFVDDRTPPGAAPVLDDGTVSFAVYGTVRGPERQAGVRARFRAGDPLAVELLVPDLAPEDALSAQDLPRVAIVSPSGATTELTADRREPFVDPSTGTSYLWLASRRGTAEAGVYAFTVTARRPARFVLAIGDRDVPGTVSGGTPPAPGALEAWYSTPPPDVAEGPAPAGDDGEPTSSAAAVDDLDPARFAGGGADDSSPGRAAGLPLAVAAAVVLGVVVTAVLRGRRARGVGPQLRDGSGPQ
jgi:hypothetical protein